MLLAIGLPHDVAQGSLRITFGEDNTKEDVDFLVDTLVNVVEKLRDTSQEYKEFISK